jgi:hypothetical protein
LQGIADFANLVLSAGKANLQHWSNLETNEAGLIGYNVKFVKAQVQVGPESHRGKTRSGHII